MSIYYEWDIETVDEHGDVVDHHHADKLAELPVLEERELLVLVWNEGNESDGVLERLWAYVTTGGDLPIVFSDGRGKRTTIKVPRRFHIELVRERAKTSALTTS